MNIYIFFVEIFHAQPLIGCFVRFIELIENLLQKNPTLISVSIVGKIIGLPVFWTFISAVFIKRRKILLVPSATRDFLSLQTYKSITQQMAIMESWICLKPLTVILIILEILTVNVILILELMRIKLLTVKSWLSVSVANPLQKNIILQDIGSKLMINC